MYATLSRRRSSTMHLCVCDVNNQQEREKKTRWQRIQWYIPRVVGRSLSMLDSMQICLIPFVTCIMKCGGKHTRRVAREKRRRRERSNVERRMWRIEWRWITANVQCKRATRKRRERTLNNFNIQTILLCFSSVELNNSFLSSNTQCARSSLSRLSTNLTDVLMKRRILFSISNCCSKSFCARKPTYNCSDDTNSEEVKDRLPPLDSRHRLNALWAYSFN